MKKIAIAGVSNKDRLIMCNALSYLTGFDIVRCTPHAGYSIKHGLSKNIKEYKWHELYAYILQSFIERIEVESSYDEFISNGSVFHELAYMEATETKSLYKKNIRNKGHFFMNNSLRSIISEYAQRYDCIIHITQPLSNVNNIYSYLDECLKELIKSSGVKSFFYTENTLFDILDKFSKTIDIKTKISSYTAIKKAEFELLKK